MKVLLLSLACLGAPANAGAAPAEPSFLYQPSYGLDDRLRLPAEPYVPQPGDLFLATAQERWARVGHWLAGAASPHHSGVLFRRPDGRLGLVEAGPFNSLRVEVMDPLAHMRNHVGAGDCVWVRRRRVPLTEEQSARLTAFAERQEGKSFAWLRLAGQVTPLRSRGPLRTYVVGKPHGERSSFFCSELVLEGCVAAGLLDPEKTRPAATYPRDLFFDRSPNPFLDHNLDLSCWQPPRRWTECPVQLTPEGR